MAIGAVIGAVVAIGGAIISGVMSSQDTEEVNRVGLQLANIKREDDLKIQEANERMNKLGLEQRKKEFGFQRKEARLDRAEREKDRQYGKREKFKADNLDFVNKNAQSRQLFKNSVRRDA